MKFIKRRLEKMMLGRPPRRGTWIEISTYTYVIFPRYVVPRVGGRGLKSNYFADNEKVSMSSPA